MLRSGANDCNKGFLSGRYILGNCKWLNALCSRTQRFSQECCCLSLIPNTYATLYPFPTHPIVARIVEHSREIPGIKVNLGSKSPKWIEKKLESQTTRSQRCQHHIRYSVMLVLLGNSCGGPCIVYGFRVQWVEKIALFPECQPAHICVRWVQASAHLLWSFKNRGR